MLNMNKLYLLSLLIFLPFFNYSQYCTNVGPGSNADSNVESVNLTGDVGGINFIGCPGVLGLQDLTNLSTTLSGGSNYSITVQFGTCGGNYSGKGEVWIDFNNDGFFTTDESIGTWSGTPPTAASVFNFSVPSSITNGLTRMRISHQEGGGLSFPLNPCATFQWGSMMDFSINLTGGIDCSGYIGDSANDPIITNTFPYSHTYSTSVCYTNNNYAYQSPDVFYLVLPNANSSSLNVSLCGSSFDTFLSVFDTDGNSINFNDDGSCGSQSELSFSTVDLDSAYVIVEGWGSENGDYELNIFETPLGIETHSELSVLIYPNPVSETFTIQNIQNKNIVITDVTGKEVLFLNNYTGESISIIDFKKGVYFVSFLDNNVTTTLKLIVSK